MRILKIRGADGKWLEVPAVKGTDGATFTPHMSVSGDLSWTNDKGLTNPQTINLMGKNGIWVGTDTPPSGYDVWVDTDAPLNSGDVEEYIREMVDARTGYDGTVYNSVGTAIREQVGSLKDHIDTFSEDIAAVNSATTETIMDEAFAEYTEELGYVLGKDDAQPVSMGDKTHYVVSSPVPVTSGETLYITASSQYRYVVYAFYDTDGEVVEQFNSANEAAYTKLENYEVTVPENASTLRIAYQTYETANPGVKRIFQAIRAKRKWVGKKWVCVGDSLTESNSRTDKNYHDYVAEVTGISVVNMGKSGSGYARKADSGQAFYQRITNVPADADVVTIFGSGNDMGAGLELGTPSDTGTTTLCGCINTTIDNLIAIMPTVSLGIVSPTPWISYPPSNTENAMAKYSEALKTICEYRSIPFLDLYHCSNLRPWTQEGREACYTKDDGNGVHPDETGHKLIAARFKAFLETLIM